MTQRRAGRPSVSTPEWKTRNQIALKSKIDRETVTKYLAMEGAPQPDRKGRYHFKTAMDWIEKNAIRAGGGQELRMLREAILRLDKEDREIELALKRGRLIDGASIAPGVAEIQTWWGTKLQAVFEGELPRKYEGKSTIDRQKLNADAIDRLMREFKERMAALARGGRAA